MNPDAGKNAREFAGKSRRVSFAGPIGPQFPQSFTLVVGQWDSDRERCRKSSACNRVEGHYKTRQDSQTRQ